MLFYQKTIVVCESPGHLRQLISVLGPNYLFKLIDTGILEVHYSENFTGIKTDKLSNGTEAHDPVVISLPQHGFQNELYLLCNKLTGKSGKGRRLAINIAKRVKIKNFEEKYNEYVRNQILDQQYIRNVVQILINTWIPEIRHDSIKELVFDTKLTDKGIIVNTNIDFQKLNFLYHKRIPSTHSSVSTAYLLANVYDIENDLFRATTNLSEIVSTQQKSSVIDIRLKYLSDKCRKSNEEINTFQRTIIPGMKTIREEYNKGSISISEIIDVIIKTSSFKKWLADKPVDSDLLREYLNEISKKSILDKLPSKSVRWSLFTGAGIFTDVILPTGLGTITGISLSILDGFIIDKILKGWRPNQYIEEYFLGLFKD